MKMSSPGGQCSFPGECRGNRKGRKGEIPIKCTLLKSKKVELHRGKAGEKSASGGERTGKNGEKGRIPSSSREKDGAGQLFREKAAEERMRRFPYGRIRLFTGAVFLFSCRFRLENFPDVVE